MGRGERVARIYIGLVLLGQAVVSAWDGASPAALGLQIISAGVLLLVYLTEHPSPILRALTALPAVGVAAYWATVATPFGSMAWIGWGAMTAWLCIPAGWDSTATLAERFHGRPRREHHSGEHWAEH